MSGRWDSNPRCDSIFPAWKAGAIEHYATTANFERIMGFEPTTFCMASRHSKPTELNSHFLSKMWESNPVP